MKNKIAELFSYSTNSNGVQWTAVVKQQQCLYLHRRCTKVRKSIPSISIGTCMIRYGKGENKLIICPHRFLEKGKVFLDCIHLLSLHEPGNELHIVSEVAVPGGSVDYLLVSARDGKVRDFVGIELQALDTTGTIWPDRQQFLQAHGVKGQRVEDVSNKSSGINWKMTAKTTLVQLLHKIETFEHISKKLVLIVQEDLLGYMEQEFSFTHVSRNARIGDSMHIHAYTIVEGKGEQYQITLAQRLSTDAKGVALCMGLKSQPVVEFDAIVRYVEARISTKTLLTL